MPKSKSKTLDLTAAATDTAAEPEETYEPAAEDFHQPSRQRLLWRAVTLAVCLPILAVLMAGAFNILYAGKVYPGVTAFGVPLGGLNRAEAISTIERTAGDYERELIPIEYGTTTIRISPAIIGTDYDAEATAEAALKHGRGGGFWADFRQGITALVGRQQQVAVFHYDQAKLASHVRELDTDINRPVANASLDFAGGSVTIKPAIPGRRLDIGRLIVLLDDRLATGSSAAVSAPVYELAPVVDTAALEAAKSQAAAYLSGSLSVKYGSRTDQVEPVEVIPWIRVERTPPTVVRAVTPSRMIDVPAPLVIALDEGAIAAYVASLAKQIDQPGQDAALTITDGRATVFRPSRDGVELNQPAAISAIKTALTKTDDQKALTLDVKVTKPSVTEDSLNDLGINELISEGVSFFPGSARERIQNVRVGAARFNGVLIKPGETFSFNAILGDVGPETGYAPARVILKDRQEIQYGGGLCQVSSTAFRAALNAGVPITARINHSYAVPYYTQPYGVPGVDATIYLPNPDFKFTNDTGSHILIQTVLSGTTLKFQFYGTKAKEGRIRGPFFVTGSSDATQPSHTVFYRDVVKDGQVVKTDTFHSYYKSSNDFPLAQFN